MYQSITILGNLGADPEMRYTGSGVPVTSMRVAVSKQWIQDGEKREKTTWFRVTVWREAAKACAEHLKKGSKVLVVGEVDEPSVYTNKAGETVASLEITGQTVKFLSGKPQEEGSTAQTQSATRRELRHEDIPF